MAQHLVAAARALSADEPERAYEHAKVARRFAGRIGVVREASGIAAYRAGQYAEALGDLRAARRMTGSDAYLPIMADCERGLGRPERALDLIRSREAERLDRAGKIELAIVESGARRDLGQHDAAVITLQRVPELRDPQPKPWSARLAFAYADALAEAGHEAAATDWFARAMAFDEDGETDAAERYAELTGAVIEDLEEDFDEDVEDFEDVDGDLDDITGDLGDEQAAKIVDSLSEQLDAEPDDDELEDTDLEDTDLEDTDLEHVDLEDAGVDADAGVREGAVAGASAGATTGEPDATDALTGAADEGDILSAEAGSDRRAGGQDRGPTGTDQPQAVAPAAGGETAKPAEDALAESSAAPKDTGHTNDPKDPKGEVTTFGPAFIEPNFGDVLDDDPDDSEDRTKHQP